MTEAPGTDEAAFLAFAIVDELINKLIAKGVLTQADTLAMLDSLVDRLGEEPRALAKPGAEFLRKMIAERKLE